VRHKLLAEYNELRGANNTSAYADAFDQLLLMRTNVSLARLSFNLAMLVLMTLIAVGIMQSYASPAVLVLN
jgi:hypothetical protein